MLTARPLKQGIVGGVSGGPYYEEEESDAGARARIAPLRNTKDSGREKKRV
jgi:hypothetical protein